MNHFRETLGNWSWFKMVKSWLYKCIHGDDDQQESTYSIFFRFGGDQSLVQNEELQLDHPPGGVTCGSRTILMSLEFLFTLSSTIRA